MSRQTLSPSSRSFHVSADWPLNFGNVTQDGTVEVKLDILDAGSFNRPTSVTVVFYPGTLPVTVDQALAAGLHASADVPVQSPLQNGPTVVTVKVDGVIPGDYTLLIVGTYPA